MPSLNSTQLAGMLDSGRIITGVEGLGTAELAFRYYDGLTTLFDASGGIITITHQEWLGRGAVICDVAGNRTSEVSLTLYNGQNVRLHNFGDLVYAFTETAYEPVLGAVTGDAIAYAETSFGAATKNFRLWRTTLPGPAGNVGSLIMVDPGAIDSPIASNGEDSNVNVSLATSHTGVITSTAAEVQASVQDVVLGLVILADSLGGGVVSTCSVPFSGGS